MKFKKGDLIYYSEGTSILAKVMSVDNFPCSLSLRFREKDFKKVFKESTLKSDWSRLEPSKCRHLSAVEALAYSLGSASKEFVYWVG